MSPRVTGVVGALVVATAIAVGAFGAHTLAGLLTPQRLGTLDTAVTYQFYGGLGLLVMAALGMAAPGRVAAAARTAAVILGAGMLLFCGALYTLVAGGPSFFGIVAPFGGAAMILAWVHLAYGFWRQPVTR